MNNIDNLLYKLSIRHTKTTKYKEINKLEIYDSNLEYLDNIMKYYLDLQDGIEELNSITEDYYLLLINISKIYKLINNSIYYLNKWNELNCKIYREVLLIDKNRGYFIVDLYNIYKDNYNINIIEKYKLKYNMYDYDIYLLLCLIGKIDKIKFSKDINNNIMNINKLIDYVECSNLLLEEYKCN